MATADTISIDSSTNEVVLKDVRVQDAELVSYLSEYDSDDQKEAVSRALQTGASALQLVDTSTEAEIVEQRFAEMEREFEAELEELREELNDRFDEDDGQLLRILDDHFGDDGQLQTHLQEAFGSEGKFAERLEEQLGEDGEKIQEALDPQREGTPTHRLQQRIVSEIETVKERFDKAEGKAEGKAEIREKTTLKGYDFEDQIEELLGDLVHQTPNQFRDTSQETGEITNSKKGDFVITLDDTDQQIVVEAKNGEFPSTVESEMETAIENRDADYGILVASSLEYLPRTRVGWFSEIDQDYLVVALSEDAEDEIETSFFKFAYHWARTRTLLSAVDVGDDIDPEAVKNELDGIQDAISKFSKIRTDCKNLTDTAANIRGTLQEIQDDVTERLRRLEAELDQS